MEAFSKAISNPEMNQSLQEDRNCGRTLQNRQQAAEGAGTVCLVLRPGGC